MEMHGSGRRYSGYDEYEGIFGPLGGSSSTKGGSQSLASKYGRSTSSSAAAMGFEGRAFPASRRQRSTNALSSNGYERRQRYLSGRVNKRRVKTVDVDDDGDEQESGDGPRRSEHQQIWLPTKNFTFRQRAGKLDTRTIARLDLEKIVATTDVEAIQRHLENVAFSDVTLEDVQQYSDAYFLKLFQIAQLTLEYLLNVQDSLASHCENLETQCEGLADECQSLEVENQKVQSEISAMKKEIRQKQSTLATFEMMLLNATAAKRANQGLRAISQQQFDQENDPAVLNILGGPVKVGDAQEEIGAVPLVSACVLCGKQFISPEYLLRHQQKKHRDYAAERDSRKKTKKKKKWHSDSSSASGSRSSQSGSDSKKAKKRREPKTAPLPAEVIQALNERNELTKQLMELQFQLRSEKERRVEEAKTMEQQQTQLATQLTSYMAKLQDTLVEMEKKQEQSKHEMMRYTQETIDRMKTEQAEPVRDTKKSHAGRLQSDGESDSEKMNKGGTKASETASEVERRILDSLLRTQAETQQKNSELEQANRRLQNRLKRRARQFQAEPTGTTLMSMAAMDAQRFGIDVGAAFDEEKPAARQKALAVEDKPVQTDEEKEKPSKKVVVTQSQVVQTELPIEPVSVAKLEPKPKAEPPKPLLKKAESKIPQPKMEPKVAPPPPQSKPVPKPIAVEETKPRPSAEAKEATVTLSPAVESKPESKFQHAAHLVGKVALGFLTRNVLKNPSNWLLTLPALSLTGALSASELAHLTQSQPSGSVEDITIEIEDEMTANDLRVAFAEALSGFESEKEEEDADDALVVDYHRVLLHHRVTGQEISGDQFIYHLRNQLEVEIIPRFDAAEVHVDDVLTFHEDVTNQLREIRRASMDLTADDIGQHTRDEDHELCAAKAATRIQSVVRRFLAFRFVEMMKIDRLVDARLLSMRSLSSSSPRPRSKSVIRLTRSASVVATRIETTDETVVAEKAQEIHDRLADLVKSKTGIDTRTKSAKWSRGRLTTEDYERHVDDLQRKREELPVSVQTRIQQISERVEKLVEESYDPETAKKDEHQYIAASRIQLAVQVGVARKKLKQLLGLKKAEEAKSDSEVTIEKEKISASTRRSESEEKQSERDEEEESKPQPPQQTDEAKEEEDTSLDVEELDDSEIKRLADAYEHRDEAKPEPKPTVETPQLEQKAPVVDIFAPVTRAQKPKPDVQARPGTPPPSEADLAGRSPRPQGDAHVISPFSKTPLLSRRAPPSRRGSGYDNAR